MMCDKPEVAPARRRGGRDGDRPRSEYPRIVRFFETIDAPDSQCPHCGATGRYILRFQVADGRRLAAMRGCASLFPTSPVAHEELRLRQKLESLQKRFGRQTTLNRNDARAMDAIQAFVDGVSTEDEALRAVTLAKRANTARYRR